MKKLTLAKFTITILADDCYDESSIESLCDKVDNLQDTIAEIAPQILDLDPEAFQIIINSD